MRNFTINLYVFGQARSHEFTCIAPWRIRVWLCLFVYFFIRLFHPCYVCLLRWMNYDTHLDLTVIKCHWHSPSGVVVVVVYAVDYFVSERITHWCKPREVPGVFTGVMSWDESLRHSGFPRHFRFYISGDLDNEHY